MYAHTILEGMAAYRRERDRLLADPSVRDWVKQALVALDRRDPVDALDDAELVMRLFRMRADAALGRTAG